MLRTMPTASSLNLTPKAQLSNNIQNNYENQPAPDFQEPPFSFTSFLCFPATDTAMGTGSTSHQKHYHLQKWFLYDSERIYPQVAK